MGSSLKQAILKVLVGFSVAHQVEIHKSHLREGIVLDHNSGSCPKGDRRGPKRIKTLRTDTWIPETRQPL
jgi:hypothetical protein